MKNKKDTFLKGIFTLILSQIIIKVIGLVYKLYLTNKEGFGDTGNAIYSSGFQIYALLLSFSSTGVPNALSKLISERVAIGDNRGAHRIFKISFFIFAIIGGIGATLLFIYAKNIAVYLIQIPEAEYSLIALAPSIFFVAIIAVFRGYFNGMQNFSVIAKSQSIEQIFKTIFTIIIVEYVSAFSLKNTMLMAAGANLATSVATVTSFMYVFIYFIGKRKEIAQDIKSSTNYIPTRIRKTIKKIICVSFPISLSSIMSSCNKNIDSFTVVRFLKKFMNEDEAKRQYGILSGKVDTLCMLPLSLNIALVTTLVPSISIANAKNNIKEVREKSKLFLLINFLIGIPTTVRNYVICRANIKIAISKCEYGSESIKNFKFSYSVYDIISNT